MFDTTDLTAEQEKAATHQGSALLIVAGAGTGKTTTLTARLAHLLASGVPPQRILLLTFSRRAAADLLNRAEQLTGPGAHAAWGGTFHAVANRLLRRYGGALGLPPSFTVLDTADTAEMMALAREGSGKHNGSPPHQRRARKQTLADIHSRCVNSKTPLSRVLRTHFPWCAEEKAEIRETFKGYALRKRAQGVLDYDDLLLYWAALLATPDVARILQKKFDHILVDEFQDTNALQADLLEGMCSAGTEITAVGDDAQSIYSFRAATHANIMEFPTRFNAKVVTLEQNHRSTPALLAATNALIDEAANRHPKNLWSNRADLAQPVLMRCADEDAQSREVCARILQHHEKGTPLQAQAVLVRTSHHSDLLELELAARNIPFIKYGGLKFLEATHVKDLVCLLRLVENPKDELAWFRILQLLDRVGPAAAHRLTALLAPSDNPAAHLVDCLEDLPPQARSAAQDLATALVDSLSLGPTSAVPVIERMRRWLDPTVKTRYPNAPARLSDLEQLQSAAGNASGLSQFLTDLALDPPAATSDLAGPPHLDEDFITISTIHWAKGAEWDVVHVLHLTDGHIPSDLATGDAEAIEEERRLLYVAMTRARNHLYAYAPLRYHHRRYGKDDVHGYGQLTRFITPEVLATMEDITPAPLYANPADNRLNAIRPAAITALEQMVTSLWD